MFSITDYGILEAERFGSLWQQDNDCETDLYEEVGICESCSETITTEYSFYADGDDNLFCCKKCFDKYYGITEINENDRSFDEWLKNFKLKRKTCSRILRGEQI